MENCKITRYHSIISITAQLKKAEDLFLELRNEQSFEKMIISILKSQSQRDAEWLEGATEPSEKNNLKDYAVLDRMESLTPSPDVVDMNLKIIHTECNRESVLIAFEGERKGGCELDYHILQQEMQRVFKAKDNVDIGACCFVEDKEVPKIISDVLELQLGKVIDRETFGVVVEMLKAFPPQLRTVPQFLQHKHSVQELLSLSHSEKPSNFWSFSDVLFPNLPADSRDKAIMQLQLKKFIQALIGQNSVSVHVNSFDACKHLYYITLPNENLGVNIEVPEKVNEGAALYISPLEAKISNTRTHACQNEFQALMKKIADVYNQCGAEERVLKNPEPGSLCCARYRKDGCYYRDETWVKEENDFFKKIVSNRLLTFQVIGKQGDKYIVNALSDFSCQLQNKLPELDTLMNQIQTYYKEHTHPYKAGQMACVVKGPRDGKWYRGSVVRQVSPDEVDVIFVDYGYRERVVLNDLQAILPDFLTLESQAFQCALRNLTCTVCALVLLTPSSLCNIVDLQTPFDGEEFLRLNRNTETIEALMKKMTERDQAVIVSRESNGQIVVELYDEQLQVRQKIEEKILEELAIATDYVESFAGCHRVKCHVEDEVNNRNAKDCERTKSKTKLAHRVHEHCHTDIGQNFGDVEQADGSTRELCSHQRRHKENVSELSILPSRAIPVNCEAKGAVIKALKLGNLYEIEFIDYGTAYFLSKVSEKLVACKFIKQHGEQWEVDIICDGKSMLYNLQQIEGKTGLQNKPVHEWKSMPKQIQDMNDLNSGQVERAEIIIEEGLECMTKSERNSKWYRSKVIKIYLESSRIWEVEILIGEILLIEYLNQPLSLCQTIKLEKSDNVGCKEFAKSFRINSIAWTPLRSGRRYPGIATMVTDPSNFCVQFEDFIDCVKKLSLLLSDVPENLPALPEEYVVPGTSCLIQFGLAAQWNRAEISEVTSQFVVLRFVDYGFLKSIPYSAVHKLKVIPEALSFLPRLTYSCSLHGMVPAEGKYWSTEAKLLFQKLLCKPGLMFRFNHYGSGMRLEVDILYEESNIAHTLVAAGYAVYSASGCSCIPVDRRIDSTCDLVERKFGSESFF
ncbi:UNVERIFIED_CONTAM: hypothetical protein H355_010804 [Colinus virginianus]|nr:hypothetical protein H355_010804 [Colinus virginianus]